MRRDREDRAEGRLQAFVLPRLGRDLRLQERGVGLELRRNEKRHVLHGGTLGETLANTLTLGEGIAHGWSWQGSIGHAHGPAAGNGRDESAVPALLQA
jgi:hypothetical protein